VDCVQERERFHDVEAGSLKDWAERSEMEKGWMVVPLVLAIRRGLRAGSEGRVEGLLMLWRARALMAVEATTPARLRSCKKRMVIGSTNGGRGVYQRKTDRRVDHSPDSKEKERMNVKK
jgi:hypothetical protein